MMVEAFIGDNIRPTQGGSDAISLQNASAGWVTWASGLLGYRRAGVSPRARGTSDHRIRKSVNELFAADGCVQVGFL